MKGLFALCCAFALPLGVGAQAGKIPVSVSHTGNDSVGTSFVEAFRQDLSHSTRYRNMKADGEGPQFYIDVITVDTGTAGDRGEK